MYTEDEYQTYLKVQALKRGQLRYGWVTVSACVHPDDAPRLRGLADEIIRARSVDLLERMAKREEAPPRKFRLNGHEQAVMALLRQSPVVKKVEIRRLIESRVANPSSHGKVVARTMDKLARMGLGRHIDRATFGLTA